jgi:hypothetical protein
MKCTDLTDLTDDALMSRVSTLKAEGHVLTARLIVLLIEVEERRLELRSACTSMFDFCQRRLGMSEGAAFRRITAARLVKRFPALLKRIARGEMQLSTMVLLRPHLDEKNVEELAVAVAGQDAASGRGAACASRTEAGCAVGDRGARCTVERREVGVVRRQ